VNKITDNRYVKLIKMLGLLPVVSGLLPNIKVQQSLDRPWGFQEVEALVFPDNWHRKVVRL